MITLEGGGDRCRKALVDIAEERARQIEKGYTPEHDDQHGVADLLDLARNRLRAPVGRKHLVESAALLIAAIELRDRRNAAWGRGGEVSATESGAGERAYVGVRCELCGVVRPNAMESRGGVVRCQDRLVCEQVVALVEHARSTYADLIEAGWKPATPDADDAQVVADRHGDLDDAAKATADIPEGYLLGFCVCGDRTLHWHPEQWEDSK